MTLLFSCNFSNDKIDLNGRLLYFGGTSKINKGNFSIAAVTTAK